MMSLAELQVWVSYLLKNLEQSITSYIVIVFLRHVCLISLLPSLRIAKYEMTYVSP